MVNFAVDTEFQYHTGSIKSVVFVDYLQLLEAGFQYHTGSIKRRNVEGDFDDADTGFNTTLVQLKGWI